MICMILAAGYATRLYPLTKNFPKSLLKVQGKTILDHLTDDLEAGGMISEFVVISNHVFYHHFQEWADTKPYKITVIDDGTETNETRLGAVKDIEFALSTLNVKDDVFVIAGDNVLDFSLNRLLIYAKEKGTSAVMRYFEEDRKRLTKSGVLSVSGDRVVAMEEKPEEPKSNWCCPPFYVYKKEDIARVGEAIKEGCGVDAPGSFIAWLSQKTEVNAMEMPGKRFDIGNLESYERVQKEYQGIKDEA